MRIQTGTMRTVASSKMLRTWYRITTLGTHISRAQSHENSVRFGGSSDITPIYLFNPKKFTRCFSEILISPRAAVIAFIRGGMML